MAEQRAGDDPAASLIDGLVQTTFTVMALLTTVAAEHDLSLTQLRVLGILRDRQVRVSALAAHLGLDKSTMSGLVDRAERRGLVTRAPDPDDGRAVAVSLTEAGAELADAGYRRLASALAPAIDRLAPADQNQLQTLLRRMLGPAEPLAPGALPGPGDPPRSATRVRR